MTNKELEFTKRLEELKTLAKEQGNLVTTFQVETLLQELELTETQMSFVYEYLKKHKIGVDEEVDLDSYLTKEDKDYLEVYLEELEGLEQVTEGEKYAITMSAMAGELDSKMQLIEIYLLKVVELSKLYTEQGVFVEDLIGEGNLALSLGVELLGALETPDEAEGMLGKLMMDAMENYIIENTEASQADKVALEKANFLKEKSKEIAELLQRKISPEELANEAAVSLDEILDILRITGGNLEYVEEAEDGEQ